MRTLTDNEFRHWAKTAGVQMGDDPSRPLRPRFVPESQASRFWCVPAKPETRPYFIATLLNLMGEWQSCFAWRPLGSWPEPADTDRMTSQVEHEILRGIGIPSGTREVVEFGRGELDKLVALIFTTTIFARHVGEDLSVIPDHGRFILEVSHHDVIHVEFREPGEVSHWVGKMTEEEYPLPEHVPDKTFKKPSWMK